jgi:hypothetical protein
MRGERLVSIRCFLSHHKGKKCMVITMCLHQSNMMKTHGGCEVFAFRSIGPKMHGGH